MRARQDEAWQADLARYPERPWLKEQSIWAIAVYRFGRRVFSRPPGVKTRVLRNLYWTMQRTVETLTGISFIHTVEIGGGLRIWHFGNIFIHPKVRIGRNCTLRQGVTIGNRVDGGGVPVIGDDVEIGAYAQILGAIRVGSGARIGAMAVVLVDVPENATAVGNPARVIECKPGPGASPLQAEPIGS